MYVDKYSHNSLIRTFHLHVHVHVYAPQKVKFIPRGVQISNTSIQATICRVISEGKTYWKLRKIVKFKHYKYCILYVDL